MIKKNLRNFKTKAFNRAKLPHKGQRKLFYGTLFLEDRKVVATLKKMLTLLRIWELKSIQ